MFDRSVDDNLAFATVSRWCVAHTKPCQEFAAVTNLMRPKSMALIPIVCRGKMYRRQQERVGNMCLRLFVVFGPSAPRQGLPVVSRTIDMASLVGCGQKCRTSPQRRAQNDPEYEVFRLWRDDGAYKFIHFVEINAG